MTDFNRLRDLANTMVAHLSEQFDGDENTDLDVSGADLVDWWSNMRLYVREALEQPASPLPTFAPGTSSPCVVDLTIKLHLPDPELAVEIAKAAAQQAARGFSEEEMRDPAFGWASYRRGREGGPLVADLAELITGMLSDAMPDGGYEQDISGVVTEG